MGGRPGRLCSIVSKCVANYVRRTPRNRFLRIFRVNKGICVWPGLIFSTVEKTLDFPDYDADFLERIRGFVNCERPDPDTGAVNRNLQVLSEEGFSYAPWKIEVIGAAVIASVPAFQIPFVVSFDLDSSQITAL